MISNLLEEAQRPIDICSFAKSRTFRLKHISILSAKRIVVTRDFATRSEPARSTKSSLATLVKGWDSTLEMVWVRSALQ